MGVGEFLVLALLIICCYRIINRGLSFYEYQMKEETKDFKPEDEIVEDITKKDLK